MDARLILLQRARLPLVAMDIVADHGWGRFERVTLPAGDVGPGTRTADGMTIDAWARSRHAAAVDALVARGLPAQLAWWVAVAIVGHWANEVGWGRSERDYALGNIRAGSGWGGAVHYLQGSDDPAPAPYRAYRSLADGVEDNIRLATGVERDGTLAERSRYQRAFLDLVASVSDGPYVVSSGGRSVAFPVDVVAWYAALTRAGWHPYSEESMSTYRSTITRAAVAVGAPKASAWNRPLLVGGAVGVIAGIVWAIVSPRRRR